MFLLWLARRASISINAVSLALLLSALTACSSVDVLGTVQLSEGKEENPQDPDDPDDPPGDGDGDDPPPDDEDPEELPDPLPNPLGDQGVPVSQVKARLNAAFLQLFFGDPDNEAVFFDQGDGSAYIQDINNGDVRTDSMGYGMMVTVQLNHRKVFDQLWSWTKQHMLSQSGPTEGLLHWRCNTDGSDCTDVAATDSSSIIVTSLLMAESRFLDEGEHDYGEDALALLDAMLSVEDRNSEAEGVFDLFDQDAVLPRFSSGGPQGEVDVDYLMPAFYEIWAEHDEDRAEFWREMAENARTLLSEIADPETGLYPEAISYEGEHVEDRSFYGELTSRSFLNLALDHIWFGPHEWVVEQNERRLDFFLSQGVDSYVKSYTLDGSPLVDYNDSAHLSLVAVMAGTSQDSDHDVFLDEILDAQVPTGNYRYYSGMIYILSLLVLSGQMTPN